MPENFFIRCVAAQDTPAASKAIAHYTCADGSAGATITSAVASLPSTGGTVFLLPGRFKLGLLPGDRIYCAKSNVKIIGSGPQTIIEPSVNVLGQKIIEIGDHATAFENIHLRNFCIYENPASYGPLANYGIYFTDNCTRVSVKNCSLTVGYCGVFFDKGVSKLHVANCFFDSVGDESIQFSVASGDPVNHGLVENNNFSLNGLRAPQGTLRIYSATHMQFINNIITSSVKRAASIYNESSDILFSNNILINNATDGLQSELWIESGAARVIVTGNIIKTTLGTYCIEESNNACVDCSYIGNILTGGTVARKSILSADSIWEHNQE